MEIVDDTAISGPNSLELPHGLTQLEACTPMFSLFVTIEHGLHKSPQPTSRLALDPIPWRLPVNLRLEPVPSAE